VASVLVKGNKFLVSLLAPRYYTGISVAKINFKNIAKRVFTTG